MEHPSPVMLSRIVADQHEKLIQSPLQLQGDIRRISGHLEAIRRLLLIVVLLLLPVSLLAGYWLFELVMFYIDPPTFSDLMSQPSPRWP